MPMHIANEIYEMSEAIQWLYVLLFWKILLTKDVFPAPSTPCGDVFGWKQNNCLKLVAYVKQLSLCSNHYFDQFQ